MPIAASLSGQPAVGCGQGPLLFACFRMLVAQFRAILQHVVNL